MSATLSSTFYSASFWILEGRQFASFFRPLTLSSSPSGSHLTQHDFPWLRQLDTLPLFRRWINSSSQPHMFRIHMLVVIISWEYIYTLRTVVRLIVVRKLYSISINYDRDGPAGSPCRRPSSCSWTLCLTLVDISNALRRPGSNESKMLSQPCTVFQHVEAHKMCQPFTITFAVLWRNSPYLHNIQIFSEYRK